ncbi:ABC transporter ATP-binding protein [Pseudooceanicola onchidii]|uniref:ABC transporter ATP-binding protein n=1 Tax=Pseudooceanicola onchidii TaxID=2562279 RepID=UPI0010AA888C|nr:ABC transporter ATP-binding protein [Pseudooceanicola onchidii]
MSIAHLLEDFGSPQAVATPALSDVDLEGLKLEAFENGYKAGWEDALKTRDGEQAQISGDFARNLQDLSFTYHEAQAQVMQAMGSLLQDIVDKVLPEVVRDTMGTRLVEQLTEMARDHGSQTIEIVTSPADQAAVEALLDQDFGFPVTAQADDTLGEGQVFLRMAQEERQIDMESMMSGIRQAVAGLMEESERTLKHG